MELNTTQSLLDELRNIQNVPIGERGGSGEGERVSEILELKERAREQEERIRALSLLIEEKCHAIAWAEGEIEEMRRRLSSQEGRETVGTGEGEAEDLRRGFEAAMAAKEEEAKELKEKNSASAEECVRLSSLLSSLSSQYRESEEKLNELSGRVVALDAERVLKEGRWAMEREEREREWEEREEEISREREARERERQGEAERWEVLTEEKRELEGRVSVLSRELAACRVEAERSEQKFSGEISSLKVFLSVFSLNDLILTNSFLPSSLLPPPQTHTHINLSDRPHRRD